MVSWIQLFTIVFIFSFANMSNWLAEHHGRMFLERNPLAGIDSSLRVQRARVYTLWLENWRCLIDGVHNIVRYFLWNVIIGSVAVASGTDLDKIHEWWHDRLSFSWVILRYLWQASLAQVTLRPSCWRCYCLCTCELPFVLEPLYVVSRAAVGLSRPTDR